MPPVPAIRRRGRTLGAAAALALAACIVSGCGDGSSSGLSQQRGSSLRSSLDEVQASVDMGDCTRAAQQAADFRRQVDELPSRVSNDLRDALDSSAARLVSLVENQCKPSTTVEQPAQEQTTTDESAGNQQGNGKQDKKAKKPKKPKPSDNGGAGTTGVTGVTGTTGATGPRGTTSPPGGG
jgi:hypothetical protein